MQTANVRLDMIATKPGTSEVWLVITDARDWSDVGAHLEFLQDRINEYMLVAQSDTIRRHPMVWGIAQPEFWLTLFCMNEPPAEAKAHLDVVDGALQAAGVRFRYEHQPLSLSMLMPAKPVSC